MRKLCIAIAVVIGLVTPAAPALALPRQPILDSRTLTFSGPAIDSGAPETVAVTGRMHLDTIARGSSAAGWTINVVSHLEGTSGVGQTSGTCYVANGADQSGGQLPAGSANSVAFVTHFLLTPVSPTHPPNPCTGLHPPNPAHPPSPCIVLHPPNPAHPPSPCRIALYLSMHFTADGHVAGADVSTTPPMT